MFILLSIISIFSSIFITLLVATATLDGLPPYRIVLNCFHLFWTIVLIYFELFWYILLCWFYCLIIVLTFKLFIILTSKLFTFKIFTFKLFTLSSLQYYCASVSSLQQCVPFPLYGIYLYIILPVYAWTQWRWKKKEVCVLTNLKFIITFFPLWTAAVNVHT